MWELYDFMEAGASVIDAWIASLPPGHRAKVRRKLETRLDYLRISERTEWGHYTGPLVGNEWDGILEIRMEVMNVQYRPLFCFGPGGRAMTLLAGAEERGGQLMPRGVAAVARGRRAIALQARSITPHDET